MARNKVSQSPISGRRPAEQEMERDLDIMTRLQKIGALFVQGDNLEPVLAAIVDTAIAVSGADFGNIQLLDPLTGDLRIAAHRGFPQWWIDFWETVSKGQGSCGTALQRGERVIIEDVEQSPVFAGTPALDIQRRAGVRAVQSTPLISRSGKPVGMFSTHYRTPQRPDDRALRLLDLLARQAADIIEHVRASQALRQERDLMQAVMDSTENTHLVYLDRDFNFVRVNAAYARNCGYRPEEMAGKNHFALYPHEENEAIFRRVRDRGEPFEVRDKPFVFPDQPERGVTYWDWTLTPLKDAAGAVTGLVLVLRETTERKKAEEALKRHTDELERFNRVAVGRELRMIELKKEVTEILREAGREPRYPGDLGEERP